MAAKFILAAEPLLFLLLQGNASFTCLDAPREKGRWQGKMTLVSPVQMPAPPSPVLLWGLPWLVFDHLKKKAGRWRWRPERSPPRERAAEALPGDGSTSWVQIRSEAREVVGSTSVPSITAPVS